MRKAALAFVLGIAGGALFAWLALAVIGRGTGGLHLITPPEEAARAGAGRVVLVDVREHAEVAGAMALPARWIPGSEIRAEGSAWRDFADGLAPGTEVVFYCVSGDRAARAAEALSRLGFRASIMGGFGDWLRAGLPVRKLDWNGDGKDDPLPPAQ